MKENWSQIWSHVINKKTCKDLNPYRLCVYGSGWGDLNSRPHVPQTCTLNPCATARLILMNYSTTLLLFSTINENKIVFFLHGRRTKVFLRPFFNSQANT